MDKLWNKISEDQTNGEWPKPSEGIHVMTESLMPTFHHLGDEFPSDRKKLIHCVGVTAKAKLVISNPKYTGMLKGSSDMIIRLSTGKKPNTNEDKRSQSDAYGNFVPGMAMKFLRDGLHAANLVAMNTVMGSHSWNFFEDELTNNFKIPLDADFKLQLLSRRFISMTPFISSMGVYELSAIDQEGKKEENPKFPFKMLFRPNEIVKSKFSKDYTEHYVSQLKSIKAGTILYEVYAHESPECAEEKIGYIELRSDLISSKFGDEKLMFRHTLLDSDIEAQPSWTDYYDQFGWLGAYPGKRVEEKKKCPFSSGVNGIDKKKQNNEL
jgi:hypothetical protein